MRNSVSKLMNSKVAERVEHHVQSFPPAITFAKSKKSKKKKLLSYFNSTYQAFKKKRPVKTKNFPKLGDSVLPQSSCKAPNPA